MKLTYLSAVLFLSMPVACATTTRRGSVVMKINDKEAHVCMGDKEVKAGDRVVLFKSVCRSVPGGGTSGYNSVCEKVRLGEGIVEKTLNEHYSIVKVDHGVAFEEGTVIEKE